MIKNIARMIKKRRLISAILFCEKEELHVRDHRILNIEAAIDFIEQHLDGRLDLETVASALHYSKYHLHRMFTRTVGMTVHDYVQRRQLTEAAKLLVFSEKPVIEIAILCGYESQQAFSAAFKAMYKTPPAAYRERQDFYPLQLKFTLHREPAQTEVSKSNVRFAKKADVDAWMEIVRLAVDGYPCLDEAEYLHQLENAIRDRRALVFHDGGTVVGVLIFSYRTGSIDFMGVHPQYRNRGIQRIFLDKLLEELLPMREISMTTYREGDRADTGYRDELKALGFAERELLVEYHYPTQRFVHPPKYKEEDENER